MMLKKFVLGLCAAYAATALMVAPTPSFADDSMRRIAIHVDDNDPLKFKIALNNAQNVNNYYKKKGIKVKIRIVAYGPGLHMYRQDTSPVKSRIASMALKYNNISFAACGNTHRKMSKKAGKKIALISEAKMVPSGVVELVELQRKGWTYIRP